MELSGVELEGTEEDLEPWRIGDFTRLMKEEIDCMVLEVRPCKAGLGICMDPWVTLR